MLRSFKYRFYPTQEQEMLLRRTIGSCRFVYNKALSFRNETWASKGEQVKAHALIRFLPIWKKEEETAWLSEVSSVALQQSINNLAAAFENFFNKRGNFPKFKKKASGGSARFVGGGFSYSPGRLKIAKCRQPLPIVWSRHLPAGATPSSCTVSLRPNGAWFVSLLVDDQTINPLPESKNRIGLDMGITSLVTTSEGEKISNPKPYRKQKRKLARHQRHLDRKKPGSKNWQKTKVKVARIHQRISDIRKDQLHKLTTRLVRENQSIAIEDLSVRNMCKNRQLASSISDAGWGELRRQLEYKCTWYGRELRVIDRWFPSSKTCHGCGHVAEKLPLNIRNWDCPRCGVAHDRDVNAARNILSAGHVDHTCGGAVRPKRVKVSRQASAKQVTRKGVARRMQSVVA